MNELLLLLGIIIITSISIIIWIHKDINRIDE